MIRQHTFLPNWVSPPGETMADILEERHLLPAEFAPQIGWTVEQTNRFLEGRLSITSEIANQLERALGAPATFWINRERQYRDDLERLQVTVPGLIEEKWLKELPVKDMVKYGWISPVKKGNEIVNECLKFFGVPNISAWRDAYGNLLQGVALRTSPTFQSQLGATAAWLRQGEVESASMDYKNWDPKCFIEALPEIRSLTRRRRPEVFIPELQKVCGECGVAVVIVRSPSGCRASGATHFVSPNKALILLSFRYLSDDHFWFTFFHEAGHLLLHSKKSLFLEGVEINSHQEEREANEFASEALIPSEFESELSKLPLDGREVIRFARKVGVSPGIVVGQLQHRRLIDRHQLNTLKTRFTWG